MIKLYWSTNTKIIIDVQKKSSNIEKNKIREDCFSIWSLWPALIIISTTELFNNRLKNKQNFLTQKVFFWLQPSGFSQRKTPITWANFTKQQTFNNNTGY